MPRVSVSSGGRISEDQDPDGIQLGEKGAKLDRDKPDLLTALEQFPNALAYVSEVCFYGAEVKGYGWESWKHLKSGETRYKRACVRHLSITGADSESDLDHMKHAAWNALATLEFMHKNGTLK